MEKISTLDQAYVWHPFTQMQTAHPPIPIARAKGAYLYTPEGHRYLDGISSWWVNLHGHCHPYIVESLKEQLDSLDHVIFAGFTHFPAAKLASRLLPLLPGEMSKIFYSDNGSTAVETALKMAIQYWHNKGTPKRKVICFKGSYHGDTFGAMSAAGKNRFNTPFWNHLFEVHALNGADLDSLRKILEEGNAAFFIFEPLVLAAGGMRIYPAESLDPLIALCKQHQVITIADEVMTGFGRTGPLFACERLQEKPDIICLSKGITGGFLPLGATACTQTIYNAFLGNHLSQALLHGHSYSGNPLACTAALASLDLLLKETCHLQRKMIAESHCAFCGEWKHHPKLKRCESLGTLLALEYQEEINPLYFLKKGLLLRPLQNVLYVLPPYCIQKEELEWIYQQIISTL